MALTSKLSAIGNAIREKNGTTDLMTLDAMPAAILAIETGGGGSGECSGIHIPEEALTITGNCGYRFANNGWNWFLEEVGDKITTSDITSANYMFDGSRLLESIPFEFNFASGGGSCSHMFGNCQMLQTIPAIDFKQTSTYKDVSDLFSGCRNVKEIGTLSNMYPEKMSKMFENCYDLRYLPKIENLNMSRIYSYKYSALSSMFYNCYSLRTIPEDFLKQLYTPLVTGNYNTVFSNSFNSCYTLDEIRGLNPQTDTMTTNMFSNAFLNCYRLKDIIFATQEDGTPYSVSWKSQTLDLTTSVGWSNGNFDLTGYNSGITTDKEVTDDATYQALKNDSDWWTLLVEYSRYNHDSAVNTINSLPDTSAYGTNTIKFKGAAGSATDGGAINTLTEEEIAVATAKGWTVTLS